MWGEDGELGRVYAGCRALYTLVMRGQELVHFTKVLVAGEELLLKVACSAMSEVGKGNYLTVLVYVFLSPTLYQYFLSPCIYPFRSP